MNSWKTDHMVSIIPTCCVLVNTPPHYSLSPPVGAEQGFILSHDYGVFLLHGHAKISKATKGAERI